MGGLTKRKRQTLPIWAFLPFQTHNLNLCIFQWLSDLGIPNPKGFAQNLQKLSSKSGFSVRNAEKSLGWPFCNFRNKKSIFVFSNGFLPWVYQIQQVLPKTVKNYQNLEVPSKMLKSPWGGLLPFQTQNMICCIF